MSLFKTESQKFLSDSPDLLRYATEYMKDTNELSDAEIQAIEGSEELNDLIVSSLVDYDGGERDLIWWSGRLRLAKELDEKVQTISYIPLP